MFASPAGIAKSGAAAAARAALGCYDAGCWRPRNTVSTAFDKAVHWRCFHYQTILTRQHSNAARAPADDRSIIRSFLAYRKLSISDRQIEIQNAAESVIEHRIAVRSERSTDLSRFVEIE